MTDIPLQVAFLSIGLMGSPLAGLLHSEANCKVLIPGLAERSKESQSRAEEYGLEGVPSLKTLFKEGDPQIEYFISVLPPSEALSLAKEVADLSSNLTKREENLSPIYVDLNAIAHDTSLEISKILSNKGWKYVCGSIIGGPPKTDGFRPSVYLSGDQKSVERFRKLGEKATWKIIVLENSGIGASKALKMSYSMIAKGVMELGATSMLAASSYSSSTSSALAQELSSSLPGFLPFLSRQLENVTPKSGRFFGEFEEMSSYVDSRLDPTSEKTARQSSSSTDDNALSPSTFRPGDMFRSMAQMWKWFSKSEGKEDRHRTLMQAQEMLKIELAKVEEKS